MVGAGGGRAGDGVGAMPRGKTALLEHLAAGMRAAIHTGTRAAVDELRALAARAVAWLAGSARNLEARPFADWADAFEMLAAAAGREPLLVLDKFPELVAASPALPSVQRRARSRNRLHVLL